MLPVHTPSPGPPVPHQAGNHGGAVPYPAGYSPPPVAPGQPPYAAGPPPPPGAPGQPPYASGPPSPGAPGYPSYAAGSPSPGAPGYPSYASGLPPTPPGVPGHPAQPGGWQAVPPPRRRRGRLAIVLTVIGVVLLIAGCLGVLVIRPQYQRYQLGEVYDQVDFSVVGFIRPPGAPLIEDDNLRVVETWYSDPEIVRQEDFIERSLDSLYNWARNSGSAAPREDFAECYESTCRIGWVWHGSHQITIAMFGDFTVELAPRWEVTFTLEPL